MADYLKVIADPPKPPAIEGSWSAISGEKLSDCLYKLSNLYLTNDPDKDYLYVPGKVILSSYNNYYWHFLHEDLAYYEGLKLEIPDLQLVLLDVPGIMTDSGELDHIWHKTYPYLKFFIKNYYEYPHYVDIKKNYIFEEVYYVLTGSTVFPDSKVFDAHGLYPASVWNNPGLDQWTESLWVDRCSYGPAGLDVVTSKLKNLIPVDTSLSKKIYITRRDVNSRLRQYVGMEDYSHLLSERYYEENFLETYFSKLGYTVLALEELTYEMQMQYFLGATHIAGVAGAGFSNLHMCAPGTKLYELRVLPTYGFDYEYFSRYRGIDYTAVELRSVEEVRTFTAEEMEGVLDSIDF